MAGSGLRRATSSRGSLYSIASWSRDSQSPSTDDSYGYQSVPRERESPCGESSVPDLPRREGGYTRHRSFQNVKDCLPANQPPEDSTGKFVVDPSELKPIKKKKRRVKKLKDGSEGVPSEGEDGEKVKDAAGSEHSVKLRKKKKRRPYCEIHSKTKRNSKTLSCDEQGNIADISVQATPTVAAVSTPPESTPPQEGGETLPLPEERKVVCTCGRSTRSKSKHRPEPEGGQPSINYDLLNEFDRIIYNDDPIFSDMDDNPEVDQQIRQDSERHHKRHAANIFNAAQMVNTNTMIKFAIIQTELRNLIETYLKRAEGEVQALTRRIRLLEEDFEQTDSRLNEASSKLEEASKAADESERGRKVLENRSVNDEERILQLEKELEETILLGEEADRNYEEAARKLAITEVDLERAEARLEAAEAKILELEEELKVVGNNMKSLEISEQEASQREDSYEESIRDLTARLKDAENRATEAERTVSKLQKEVDRLEDELLAEKEKYKNISEDLDSTFAELAGF